MHLSLKELALLKACPFPGTAGYQKTYTNRSGAFATASRLLNDPNFIELEALKLIDRLLVLKYIERVGLGQLRRTWEGQDYLIDAIKELEKVTEKLWNV